MKSKWSKEDLRVRLHALRYYRQMTATEIAGDVGRTIIYLNQMMAGKATISEKTEEAVRKCLRRQASKILLEGGDHPAQEKVIRACSEYLKELANEGLKK